MYIKKSLILSLFLCLMVSSAYASNIGRTVYGAYCESISGSNFDGNLHIEDSARIFNWGNMGSSEQTSGVNEGLSYTRFSTSGTSWGGGGVTFVNSSDNETTRDMSAYYGGKLKFLVKINSSNCSKFPVGIKVNNVNTCIPLSNFSGFNSSKLNQWQEVSITLNSNTHSNITSSNLAKTSFLLLISYDANVVDSGLNIDIDYVRWVKPNTTGDFNVTVKNVSNNSTVSTTNITWSSSNFQTTWKVADQYLEIDYDKDSSTKDWKVKLYVENGLEARNGLYATKGGKEYNMAMCWRASSAPLPYSDYYGSHTTQIAEGEATDSQGKKYNYLYDSGSSSTTNPVWLYMQDLTALKTAKDIDYSTIMGYKTGGYHAYSGTYGSTTGNGYYAGSKVALYLGANCGDVAGGLKYQGNIKLVLEYDE